jgi:hypothetical protein
MTQPAKGQEPSMEEILASIRRIIADEDSADRASREGEFAPSTSRRSAAQAPRMPAPEPAPREEEIDVVLARLHEASRSASSSPQPGATEPAVGQANSPRSGDPRSGQPLAQSPFEYVARASEDQRGAHQPSRAPLMSAATTAAVGSAFDTLSQAVQPRNGRTLEDLVSELIRPMLKTWLDDNLPNLAERLVREEIERATRRKP